MDTLDYTKGLLHRISAFEKLLERYHVHRGKVSLVQVCLPSRSGGNISISGYTDNTLSGCDKEADEEIEKMLAQLKS